MLVFTFVTLIFSQFNHKVNWGLAAKDYTYWGLIWFGMTLMQLFNPEAVSREAWFYAMRGQAFYIVLTVPLVYIIFNKPKDLELLIKLCAWFTILAIGKGIMQKHMGVDRWEQQWLNVPGNRSTHILFGQLRVFSFFSDAGTYGGSMGYFGVIFSILGIYSVKSKKSKQTELIKVENIQNNEAREENKKLRLELELQKEYKKKFSELGLDIIKIPTLSETNADEAKRKASIQKDIKPVEERMAASGGLGDVLAKQAEKSAQQIKLDEEIAKGIKAQQDAYKSLARTISQDVTKALFSMYDAMQQGQSFGEAFLNMVSKLVEKMAELVIQTLIFDAIFAALTGGGSVAAEAGGIAASDVAGSAGRMLMIPKYAEGGITTKAHIGMIGEAGPEAIMPLSKLSGMMNNTFNAGAMSGGNMGGGGQFTLKGSDLVLALQRSNYSLNLRRGS